MPLDAGLASIDWCAPWLAPWRETGERVAGQAIAGLPLHEALNQEPGAPLLFVPQRTLPTGMPYERYIFDSSSCPTRQGLHDFFNGLAWLQMPQAKRQLNRVQAAQIAARGVGSARGPVRDAATLFDENGAVFHAPESLWQALSDRDWRRLFLDLRPLWAQARLLVFGHALLEKLVRPRKNLTAHVWGVSCPMDSAAEVDRWLTGQLTAERLAAKPFLPLPVLVPTGKPCTRWAVGSWRWPLRK